MKRKGRKLIAAICCAVAVVSIGSAFYVTAASEPDAVPTTIEFVSMDHHLVAVETTVTTTTQTTTTEHKTAKRQTTRQEPISCVVNLITEGNVSLESGNELAEALNALPDKLVDRFNSEGWKIYLTSKSIAKYYYDGPVQGSIGGLTVYDDRLIYISEDVAYPSVTDTVYHELGHFLDWCNGRNSGNTEFTAIYNEEKSQLHVKGQSKRQMNHARSDPSEFYAQAYMAHLLGEDLEDQCPRTYEFLLENYNSL